MAKYANKTERIQPASQRLANIEATLQDIQTYMAQNRERMDALDRVIADLEEIKKNMRRRRRIPLFSKPAVKQEEEMLPQISTLLKNPMLQSMLNKGPTAGKGLDLGSLAALLQNPMVKNLLSAKNEKKGNVKNKVKKGPFGGLGISDIIGILNNPAVQSLLKSR